MKRRKSAECKWVSNRWTVVWWRVMIRMEDSGPHRVHVLTKWDYICYLPLAPVCIDTAEQVCRGERREEGGGGRGGRGRRGRVPIHKRATSAARVGESRRPPSGVPSQCESDRHITLKLVQLSLSDKVSAGPCSRRSAGGGGSWFGTGRGQTGVRQLTVSSSLRHLASDRRRRESPLFTVWRPDGATSGPVWLCVRRPGDTAASPGSW